MTARDDGLLKTIFARVNRTKRALRSDEVFQALHSSRTMGKPIDRVRDELGRLGFGKLEDKQIERAAMAVSGKDPQRTLVDVAGDLDVPALFSRVSRALLRVVEFLAEDAGVPHVSWLPYGGVLATLARLFDRHPSLHDRNRELLARWYWRGNLSGDHRTDNRTDGPKWQAIVADEHQSIQSLLKLAPRLEEAELALDLQPYRRNTARTRIELIALAALDPRVLTGEERGQPVPLALLIEESKDFPHPVVQVQGGEKTLASYLLHPELGPEDFEKLREHPPEPNLLRGQGMDAPALQALLAGDHQAFVERRGRILSEHVRSALRLWTCVGAADHDRPPLNAYFASESA